MKSWKREVAGGLLAWYIGLTTYVFVDVEPERLQHLVPLITGLAPFTLVPALCVFGFHAWLQRKEVK